MSSIHYSLAELAQRLQADLKGDPECIIHGIAPLDKAKPGQLSFLNNPKYKKFLMTTQASAIVLAPEDVLDCSSNLIIMKNPQLGFAKLVSLFVPVSQLQQGIHPTAVIGHDTNIASTASIGANCVIGDRVSIGEGSVIHPGSVIGEGSSIGQGTLIWSNVTIYHGVKIGEEVIIHSGAVIGSDGFGFANDRGRWYKIPQVGGVVIGNDVEIGANTTIDRGALEDTVIEEGVKLDNQIQIAHNVHIGAFTAIAACTAIAGSARIGKYCMIGGTVAINGHIEIVDQVILTSGATVASSLTEPGIYSSGIPAHPNREWRKNAVRFQHLDDIARRLRKLEQSRQEKLNEN